MTTHAPCPACASPAPPVSRGLTGAEIVGTVLVVTLTCGLACPILLGLPFLASRRVCPACKGPR